MYFMASCRSTRASATGGFNFNWDVVELPGHAHGNKTQIVRSFYYSGVATLLALLIAYPLAYAIALKARPLATAAAVRGDRAVLHHLPDPDDRLEDDPRRPRVRSSTSCSASALPPDDGRLLATPAAVIAGLTYNFLPVHDPADLRQPRADRPAA